MVRTGPWARSWFSWAPTGWWWPCYLAWFEPAGGGFPNASPGIWPAHRRCPQDIPWLLVNWLLANDPVTSPLRAAFTRFAGTSGEFELSEEVRGSGPRKALGELATCPSCLGQWVATLFAFGLVLAPRPTRLATARRWSSPSVGSHSEHGDGQGVELRRVRLSRTGW